MLNIPREFVPCCYPDITLLTIPGCVCADILLNTLSSPLFILSPLTLDVVTTFMLGGELSIVLSNDFFVFLRNTERAIKLPNKPQKEITARIRKTLLIFFVFLLISLDVYVKA